MSSAAELTTEPRLLESPPGSGGEVIDTSPDPRRLAHYLEDFGQRHAALFQSLPPERLAWLQVIFASSRFLSDELLRHPAWIRAVGSLPTAAFTLSNTCVPVGCGVG